jgi:hypothetical protein
MLERATAEGRTDAEMLRRRAQDYLALTDQMVLTLSDLFESIAEDPTAWANDVPKFLPEWLHEEEQSAFSNQSSALGCSEKLIAER